MPTSSSSTASRRGALLPSLVVRRRPRPLVAMVHQRPGGVDAAPARHRLQRAADRFVYRRCDLVIDGEPIARRRAGRRPRRRPGARRRGRAGLRPAAGRRAPARSRRGAVSPSSASPTGIRTRACSSCSTPSPRCPPSDATLHLAGRDDVDADYSARVAPAAGRARPRGPCRRARRGRPLDGRRALRRRRRVRAAELRRGLRDRRSPRRSRRAARRRMAAAVPRATSSATASRGASPTPGDVAALDAALAGWPRTTTHRRRLRRRGRGVGARRCRHGTTRRRAFFAALRGSAAAAVEPADDGSARLDVDAADAGVLDEQPPRDLVRHAERPRDRRLDRADVGDDDDV